MIWTELPELPLFFDRYIRKVPEITLHQALQEHTPSAIMSEVDKLELLGDEIYAPEKWTIKQILQHCIDTEKIMSYRALVFSRKDNTMLPGFNEEHYANEADVSKRTVKDLLEEWEVVRKQNMIFFNNLSADQLHFKGNANNIPISPFDLGYVMVGHAIHHKNIIIERYFPLL